MKKDYSKAWLSSSNPRKQRKLQYHAPLHVKQKFVHAHLSRELMQKYKRRQLGLVKGDKVKIMRGDEKGKTGKVEKVDLKKRAVAITGFENIKKDGTKRPRFFEISNLLITEIILEDKHRQAVLDKKSPAGKKV